MQIFDIGHGQMLSLHARAGQRVRVVFGRIWLTQSGQHRDHFARSGDEIELNPRGQALIEALGRARVIVVSVQPRVVPSALARRVSLAMLRLRLRARQAARALLPEPS
jgi:hypothetical protein